MRAEDRYLERAIIPWQLSVRFSEYRREVIAVPKGPSKYDVLTSQKGEGGQKGPQICGQTNRAGVVDGRKNRTSYMT